MINSVALLFCRERTGGKLTTYTVAISHISLFTVSIMLLWCVQPYKASPLLVALLQLCDSPSRLTKISVVR